MPVLPVALGGGRGRLAESRPGAEDGYAMLCFCMFWNSSLLVHYRACASSVCSYLGSKVAEQKPSLGS